MAATAAATPRRPTAADERTRRPTMPAAAPTRRVTTRPSATPRRDRRDRRDRPDRRYRRDRRDRRVGRAGRRGRHRRDDERSLLGLAKVPTPITVSGTATYTLLSATKPQIQDGTQTAGTVTAGTLKADFSGGPSAAIGFELTLAMPDGTFDVVGGGGASAPNDAGAGFNMADAGYYFYSPSMTATNDAGVCGGGTCSGAVRVVFSGPDAERAIVAYVFGPGSLATNRRGVAVFQKQ